MVAQVVILIKLIALQAALSFDLLDNSHFLVYVVWSILLNFMNFLYSCNLSYLFTVKDSRSHL